MNSNRRNAASRRALRRGVLAIGQAITEFAFTLPILALLLVIAADFGRVFFVSVTVSDAARAAAQYGSQSNTNAASTPNATSTPSTTNNTMQAAACNDYGATGTMSCSGSQCTCGALTVSAAECLCPTGCVSQFSWPTTYCTNGNSTTLFVVVKTSATFTTLLNYPGVPHNYTLTGQAIMPVEE
jgi:Flp pilus assembly protein TadG